MRDPAKQETMVPAAGGSGRCSSRTAFEFLVRGRRTRWRLRPATLSLWLLPAASTGASEAHPIDLPAIAAIPVAGLPTGVLNFIQVIDPRGARIGCRRWFTVAFRSPDRPL
ncbi:hypothetical protein [Arthrobacter sp. StoSoilA2]|uniref:hypothetical protein n=1 Tax=Arthrobacter sp. StoSoilA2 TaxID=2830990 RepID=UPI001CC4F5BE|nr:hypothetical protein [Arthrobacter sp. StoSoilA2]